MMKSTKVYIAVIVAAVIALPISESVAAESARDVKWPDGVADKIDAVLTIKREAMRLPNMRSPDGQLGKRVEELMDELAALISDQGFRAILSSLEGGDIRARIALWAVDREKRKSEYSRFAKYYVNYPQTRESIVEYYYRPYRESDNEVLASRDPEKFVPIHIGRRVPNPVDVRDRVSENRYILEYCFFMPPAGLRFPIDGYRHFSALALMSIGEFEKSLVVFAEDARIFAEVSRETDSPASGLPSQALLFLAAYPADRTFRALAKHWEIREYRERVDLYFKYLWDGTYRNILKDYSELAAHHARWMALAEKEWDEPYETRFAEWLKTVPVKDPPPPINPNDPFGQWEDE